MCHNSRLLGMKTIKMQATMTTMNSKLKESPEEIREAETNDGATTCKDCQENWRVEGYFDSIDQATQKELMDVANEIARSKSASIEAKSQAIDPTAQLKIRRIDRHSMVLGHTLGRGGFCIVREVDKIYMQSRIANGGKRGLASRGPLLRPVSQGKNKNPKLKKLSGSDSGSMSEFHSVCDSDFAHAIEPKNKGTKKKSRRGRYVVKQVNPDLARCDKIAYLKGCVDLAIEYQYLASLDHPNIILCGGVSTDGPCDFLVLQIMNETLTKRFKTWMDKDRRCKGITGFFTGSKKMVQDLYQERIKAAYDIACGVNYLHQKQIVFRDLKPDNIGFDKWDQLKLFDFGLVRELHESDRTDDGMYKLTGMTGALRYMAPEVYFWKPYNLSVDVYSWSMIMWYILALEPPFGLYTHDMIADRVIKRGSRPAVFSSWSSTLSNLMKQCWDADASVRPTFSDICTILKNEITLEGEIDPTVASGVSSTPESN